MQEYIQKYGDKVQRFFIVGDSYKCSEENPRLVSFEEASDMFN